MTICWKMRQASRDRGIPQQSNALDRTRLSTPLQRLQRMIALPPSTTGFRRPWGTETSTWRERVSEPDRNEGMIGTQSARVSQGIRCYLSMDAPGSFEKRALLIADNRDMHLQMCEFSSRVIVEGLRIWRAGYGEAAVVNECG